MRCICINHPSNSTAISVIWTLSPLESVPHKALELRVKRNVFMQNTGSGIRFHIFMTSNLNQSEYVGLCSDDSALTDHKWSWAPRRILYVIWPWVSHTYPIKPLFLNHTFGCGVEASGDSALFVSLALNADVDQAAWPSCSPSLSI